MTKLTVTIERDSKSIDVRVSFANHINVRTYLAYGEFNNRWFAKFVTSHHASSPIDVTNFMHAAQTAAAYHRRLATFAAWLNERPDQS
jgi:hypothetical protein